MNFEDLKTRKDLQVTALVAFLLGCLLGYWGFVFLAIAIIIFFVWRWKDAKKEN